MDYQKAAAIAREAGEEMLNRLDWMTIKPKRILDVGCGTGEMSLALQQRYPEATVIALDSSEAMINHTKQHAALATCVCADAAHLPFANQSLDMIFANLLLPWQTDLKAILQEWRRVLRPDGLLMLTTLGLDTLQECRDEIAFDLVPGLIDMHDVGDCLLQMGFADPVLDVNYYKLRYRDPERLITELAAAGMGHLADIEKKDSYIVTYEVIYAHAFVPNESELSSSADGTITIPLSHLRSQLNKKPSI